ncbi:MAG: abscisic acid-deficient protein Aba4 family protein, partial [Pseudomonadota bacterium]
GVQPGHDPAAPADPDHVADHIRHGQGQTVRRTRAERSLIHGRALFSAASTAALLSSVGLIALPRWGALLATLRLGVAGLLSVLHVVLDSVWLFRVSEGGDVSLNAVRTLFTWSEVARVGWAFYLAFDLVVGPWSATRSDALDLSRFAQAPILLATFMFGPVGYLFFLAARATAQTARPSEATA